MAREVEEEIGVAPEVGRIIGAYGGASLENTYPNGDHVGYVTVAFECGIPRRELALELAELLEAHWFTHGEVLQLSRHEWIDAVLTDASV